jgi:hypothetical protein
MGMLLFVCPATGLEVSSGIEIDTESYEELPQGVSEILCPECHQKHLLSEVGAHLTVSPIAIPPASTA